VVYARPYQGEDVINAVLDGFFIANGDGGEQGNGAGLYFSGGGQELTLENCTFTNCRADEAGGAIYQHGGVLECDRCVLYENWAQWGAAFLMTTGSEALFCNVHLYKNGGTDGPPGSPYTLDGGAIYIYPETKFTGANLLLHDNYAFRGGGVYIWLTPEPDAPDLHRFRHATITQNVSTYGTGAGIHITESHQTQPPGHIYIDNSIIWGNISGVDLYKSTGAFQVDVRYSNVGLPWSAGITFDDKCKHVDPMFLDVPARNLRLTPDVSPCINAANRMLVGPDFADVDESPPPPPPAPDLLPRDLDLLTRIFEEVIWPATPRPDMGAYEVQTAVP